MKDIIGITNKLGLNKMQDLPFVFEQLEKSYLRFVKKMNKSDFCNTSNRYLSELAQVRELLTQAKKYNLSEQLQKYTEIEEKIKTKLQDFGIFMES